MNRLSLSCEEAKEILKSKNIFVESCEKVEKDSGQKKVFFIKVSSKKYVLKIIDVTPYDVYEQFGIFENSKLDKNIINEKIINRVKELVKRINTEIKMGKKCQNLPKLCFFDKILFKRIKNYYWVGYYIEEMVDGKPLIYKEKYSLKEVLNFLLQMLDSIEIMYNSGYVHRDIKPDNIIFNGNKYNIIDVGLGKNIKEEEGNSLLFINGLGTYGYWSPEQQNYPPDYKWNFKTDLYPLGIIAIEMLLPSCRKNFSVLNNLDKVYLIWKDEYKNNNYMMKFFRSIIVKLSNKERAGRFNTIEEAKQTIYNFEKEA